MAHRTIALVGSLLLTAAAAGQGSFVNWETPHVHPIDLTPSGATLVAVNTADNRLEVFDVSGGGATPAHVRSIPVGLDPVSVRARTESEVWVVNHLSDSISVVDLPTGRVMRTIAAGDEPADVVFAGSPQRAFVSASQLNQVRVFDPLNPAAAPTVIAIQGEEPRAMAVDSAGTTVFVAIHESGNQTTILPPNVVSVPAGPYGGQNPPPNAGAQFSPPIAAGLPPPPRVAQIIKRNAAGEWRDDNNRNWSSFVTWGLHDHDVAMINAATLTVTYASGLMNTVAGIAVAPSGAVTVVGTDVTNHVRFEPNVNSRFVKAQIASFSPANPASPAFADMNPHLTYATTSVPQATRDLSIGDPRAIAWMPDGRRAYVAGLGSSSVIATNAGGARLGMINVGQGPTGLAVNAAGTRLYVINKFDASISTIDTAGNIELSRVSFFDPTPAVIKNGRPLLYDTHLTSGLGQASCASCHIDARSDHLAWDLGNPAGTVHEIDQTCRQGDGQCAPWHPMKGPMVTQTLVGTVGNEPFHWRGDRANIAAFDAAYTGLQGDDAVPPAADMQKLTDFLATIRFPPNPNRNLDSTLPIALPVTGGNGNANNGRNIFINQPTLGGVLRCVTCHALPAGTDGTVDFPGLPGVPQTLKIAPLGEMNEKTGFNKASLSGNRGFGFNHAGDQDTIFSILSAGFVFPPGPPGQQQRRDVEAFLMCFSADTHPAVGTQTTVIDGSAPPAAQSTLLNTMTSLANGNAVGLVVKGRIGGQQRGYAYLGGNQYQSDRLTETTSHAALLASAATGSELTWTVVPVGSQTRIGIDRDVDGFFDRDELDAGSDPADPDSVPGSTCPADLDGNGTIDSLDLGILLAAWSIPAGTPGCGGALTCAADLNRDGTVNSLDLGILLSSWSVGVPTPGCP